jgi:hypothetical protein
MQGLGFTVFGKVIDKKTLNLIAASVVTPPGMLDSRISVWGLKPSSS